jgi:sortase A
MILMTALRIIGKALISIGIGVLLFVGWTLWGTGIYTAREQASLVRQFDKAPLLPDRQITTEPNSDFVRLKDFAPRPGSAVFKINIPSIDVHQVVVEGVDTDHLRMGPGHYPTCRDGFDLCIDGYDNEGWPGEKERVLVSGHRTTYGAPFWDLDKLERGDEIHVETKWGRFTYLVTESTIVDDSSRTIVVPGNEAELVLTTCNPKFSAAERLVVYSEMVPGGAL